MGMGGFHKAFLVPYFILLIIIRIVEANAITNRTSRKFGRVRKPTSVVGLAAMANALFSLQGFIKGKDALRKRAATQP